MPERIQLRRTKGWRKPEGAVNVARPSRWGNPVWVQGYSVVGQRWDFVRANWGKGVWCMPDVAYTTHSEVSAALEHSIEIFHTLCQVSERDYPERYEQWIGPLRGHDLACWCKPDQPCHADVLLDLANRSIS